MNYFELRNQFETLFDEHNIDEKADIDWIMVEVTGKTRSGLRFHEFLDSEVEKINDLISKRIQHIPLGYILNKAYFFGREYFVNTSTLIPRQDTEVLIETMLHYINNRAESTKILDIGTGSGIIAITLELETKSSVTAVDISKNALEVASKNAENLGANVRYIESNLFEKLENKKFDFIVSNPPYIKTSVIEELDPEVRLNEPKLALDGGNDGLDFYKKIVFDAKNHLNKKGMLFFEIGFDQANELKELMKNDFEKIEVIKDYSGNDRVIFGILRG